jgi:Zn-dependent peptidase ImmA (M78 family)/transcriptional regulator with XRE-family HTH domain
MSDYPNPEMLILAREVRGMTQTQLSKMSKISQSYLSLYETGERLIPRPDIEILAGVLQFPTSFFYQSGEQHLAESGEFFHRMASSIPIGTLNRIHAQLNIFRLNTEKLLEDVPVNHPRNMVQFDVREFGGDIESIAAAVRATWNISPGAIKNLTRRLEDAYVFVHAFDFNTPKLDETTQWVDGMPPIMLVNKKAPGDRLRFSIAHALGHLVLHHGLQPYKAMETEADRFAAAFLMPFDEIRAELKPITIQHLLQLKVRWQVSLQALIVRAKDVGLINETRYKSLFEQLSRAGYRKNEPVVIEPERPILFNKLIDYHQNKKKLTIAQLANKACVLEHDFRNWYLPESPSFDFVPKPDPSMVFDLDEDDDILSNSS